MHYHVRQLVYIYLSRKETMIPTNEEVLSIISTNNESVRYELVSNELELFNSNMLQHIALALKQIPAISKILEEVHYPVINQLVWVMVIDELK